MNRLRQLVLGILALAALGTVSQPVRAQSRTGYSPVTSFDQYGNAQHRYVDRSSLGTNPIFRPQTTSPANQLLRSRRSMERFGLGGTGTMDILGLSQKAQSTTRTGWYDGRGLLPRSFQEYGGFGRRNSDRTGIGVALQRREALIQATSLMAPVHRARIRNSNFVNPLESVSHVPFVEEPVNTDQQIEASLDELLAEGIDSTFEKTMEEGWESFTAGKYRAATRSFEAASTLQPQNVEPVVAEIFSYVGVGAMRTAAAELSQVVERGEDFFRAADTILMEAKFPRAADMADASIQARLHAAQNVDDVDAAALNVFVQWFLNRRAESVTAASGLARNYPTSVYADWALILNRLNAEAN